MHRIIRTILTVILCFISLLLNAQTTINVSGTTVSNNINTITYSVGQTFSQSTEDENIILSEGVLQPYEIFEVEIPTSNDNLTPEIIISAFPNPVNHFLTLKTSSLKVLSATLQNVQGKELYKIDQFTNTTRLSLENHPSGIYLVQVYHNATIVKIFKVVKN